MDMKTNRLILRRFRESDLDDLSRYLSDPEVLRYEPYKPMNGPQVEEELLLRIASEEMIAVEEAGSGRLIGNLYLGKCPCNTLELGYVFNKSFWGKGYAAEACAAVIDMAFSSGVHKIYAQCDPQNSASWRLLERLGFEREAYLKQNVYFWTDENGRPQWKDTYIYAKRNPEQRRGRG